MPNLIEEAKSGRASCRTCKKPIAKGELRLGVEVATQFSAGPSMAWHHLLCAAAKLPAELSAALAVYGGAIANRAELDAAMADALQKGHAKPGGFPYADRAPTGRAKCMQCEQPIAKDALRVAIEREIDTGAVVTRGAGYLHPTCVAANAERTGAALDDLILGLRANSRLTEQDLDSVVTAVRHLA